MAFLESLANLFFGAGVPLSCKERRWDSTLQLFWFFNAGATRTGSEGGLGFEGFPLLAATPQHWY